MISIAAAVSAALILSGVALLVLSPWLPRRQPRKRSTILARLSRRTKILILAGVAAGILVAAITGLIVAVVLVPLAVVGLPALLSSGPGKAQIEKLEALETWTRNLTGHTVVGATIEQAIEASYRTAPEVLKPSLQTLVTRLRAGWDIKDALFQFAADHQDATVDLVVAALSTSARQRGPGLAAALEDLAVTVAQETQIRRTVEADRAKPRTTARFITIISALALTGLGVAGYLNPYAETPQGQVLFGVLIAGYVGLLVWMKRMAADKPAPRILAVEGARS